MIAKFDVSAFAKWADAFLNRIESNVRKALDRTSRVAALLAKGSDLYKSRTYGLRKSIRPELQTGFRARVVASAPYAFFVENGTRPHAIVARRAKMLRFVQNGAVVFRKRVFHPGTKPRPFMHEARDTVAPLFDRLVREATTDSFR